MNVRVEVSEQQAEDMVRLAIIHGYNRIDPRKKWSDSERREAIRHGITTLLKQHEGVR
jgi:hypothetical protein